MSTQTGILLIFRWEASEPKSTIWIM